MRAAPDERCQIKSVQEVGKIVIKMNDMISHQKCHVILVCSVLYSDE